MLVRKRESKKEGCERMGRGGGSKGQGIAEERRKGSHREGEERTGMEEETKKRRRQEKS